MAKDTAIDAERVHEIIRRLQAYGGPRVAVVIPVLAVVFGPQLGWDIALASSLLPLVPIGWDHLIRVIDLRVVLYGNVLIQGGVLVYAIARSGGPDSPVLPFGALFAVATMLFFPDRVARVALLAGGAVFLGCVVGSHGIVPDSPERAITASFVAGSVPVLLAALLDLERTHWRRSVLDPLTGCLNRRAFEQRLLELGQQLEVTGDAIAVVVIDIDHFKAINDGAGHDVGDRVLQSFAYTLRKDLRRFELLYRIGGEEFVLLLPGAGADAAFDMAERLRAHVASSELAGRRVTVSCGVAATEGRGADLAALVREADAALYRAKRNGRNRTELATSQADPARGPQPGPVPAVSGEVSTSSTPSATS